MKFTFLIQGPLTSEVERNLENYKRHGDVIISCWDNDCPRLIKKLSKKCKVIKNKFFEPKGYNFQNIQYHIKTFLNGVKEAKTEYVITVRSDEYFTDTEAIKRNILKNPNKITTSNFFFRSDVLFHPSDHVIAGKKEGLFKMLIWSMDFIKDFKEDKPVSINKIGLSKELFYKDITAEFTFCVSYLKGKGIDVISEIKNMNKDELKKYHKKVMNNNYSIVRASDMGNFLFRFKGNPNNTGPTAFTNEQDFLNYEIPSIKSMKEL